MTIERMKREKRYITGVLLILAVSLPSAIGAGHGTSSSSSPDVQTSQTAKSPLRIPEPLFQGCPRRQYFGDERTIQLLGRLACNDPNPLVRQQAVLDLGRTNNPGAISIIKMVLKDNDSHVCSAAAMALCNFPPTESLEPLKEALGNTQGDLSGVIRAARYVKWPALAGALVKLLDHPDSTIRADALNALTDMGKSPSCRIVEKLLSDKSAVVRLAAAKNAALADHDEKLISALGELIRNDEEPAAIRAEALSSLAKLGAAKYSKTILSLSRNSNPLIRVGATRALSAIGNRERIAELLDDPSTPVRLAAVRATGKLKIKECTERLFQILIQSPPEETHQAARVALEKIATPAVADKAGKLFIKLKTDYLSLMALSRRKMTVKQRDEYLRQKRKVARNLASLSHILTSLKSYNAYEERIELLKKVKVLDPLLGELAASLGKFGDKRASAAVKKRLIDCADYSRWALLMTFRDPSHPKPVPEYNSVDLIQAAVDLEMTDALPVIMRFSSMGFGMYRNKEAGWVADMVMPVLVDEKTRPAVIDELRKQVHRRFAPLRCKFESAKSLGRLKATEALDDLRWLLYENRKDRRLMFAAAWAIQEITGKTPVVGLPKPYPGDWIIKSIKLVETHQGKGKPPAEKP